MNTLTFEAMAKNQATAQHRFIEYLTEHHGLSAVDACAVANVYAQDGILWLSSTTGHWSIEHGRYLEPEMIQHATELAI